MNFQFQDRVYERNFRWKVFPTKNRESQSKLLFQLLFLGTEINFAPKHSSSRGAKATTNSVLADIFAANKILASLSFG